ncbi:MAG: ABC transporter permease, partial [Acidobacteriota bacterium]
MILRTLALRPALRRPLRLLVTVVGVAAGVAAMVATVAASRAAVWAMREGVAEVAGEESLELSAPGGVPTALLGRLRPLAADARLSPVLEEVALLPATGEAVKVLGLDLLTADAPDNLPPMPQGEMDIEALLGRRGALLPEPLARRLGLAPGDDLVVTARSRPEALPVAGVFAPRRAASAWSHTVVMDVAAAQELFGRQGYLDAVRLAPRPGVAMDSLRARLTPEMVPPPLTVGAPRPRAQGSERLLRALEFNLAALSGISLLVGGVLVAITLATAVVQRRQVIAVLRSLGASPGQVGRAVLA